MRKKMYLVKYEVFATSLKQALTSKERSVYEVSLTDEKSWKPLKNKDIGLNKKK